MCCRRWTYRLDIQVLIEHLLLDPKPSMAYAVRLIVAVRSVTCTQTRRGQLLFNQRGSPIGKKNNSILVKCVPDHLPSEHPSAPNSSRDGR